ncbi:MAG: nucleotidyltransferase domain-containing protein [Betaproteobacteria bacterium]|nr:nucleotidyltransferase domain-containing protein [Betaproteobacteria bacterium]MBP6747555.1 nucleotidyltransferase domain-containing protein [bacterium]
MTSHYYAFGSVCRGEIEPSSDIDLLACIANPDPALDPQKFSIYKYERVRELWLEGNPFAWHLHFESRLIFSSDGTDFLRDLGAPSPYVKIQDDCEKFKRLFSESYCSLLQSQNSAVFHISCLFLATRNFATCYSFSGGRPIFSRNSPLLIDKKLPVDDEVFRIFARARVLSTRGYGHHISNAEIDIARSTAPVIYDWMKNISAMGVGV